MQKAFRTARPRRVAVLAAFGLALAGAPIGACVILHARADAAAHVQIDLLRVEDRVGELQTIPRTVHDTRSFESAVRTLSASGVQTRHELGRLARIAEPEELLPAVKLNQADIRSLIEEATVRSQGRLPGELLTNRTVSSFGGEWKLLDQAEGDLAHKASQAQAQANNAAIAAVLLALIICSALFWRLVRSNATAKGARALAESMIESSPDGIFAFDRDRRYVVWNKAIERLTDIKREEVVGHRSDEVPLPLGEMHFEAAAAALGGKTIELGDTELALPSTRGQRFDLVYSPLRGHAGQITGVIGHVRDVTAKNELEQELRQTQKLDAIGQLAGGIAHDFNNLLMGIGGYASLALQRVPESNSLLRHDLEEIEQATASARALTEQLLFFARRRQRHTEALDLNALVRGATGLMRRLIEPSVSIELDLREPAWVVGDGAQLEQVLLNLGSNARDAMPNGGVLTIRTRRAGPDHAQLMIEDTGTGIPDDVKPRVFEPFFTTKGPGHGTGLGLASAYGIVTQDGGSIEFDSMVGSGTTFTITLPASMPAVAEPIPARIPAMHEATATILLVDDDSVVRGLIAAGLEDEGYTVIAKPGSVDALAYVKQGGVFDFLITDVVMPGLGGAALVERIRSAVGSSFDTIYVSGYPASGIRLDEHSVFLQKPFELAELYAHVERVLLERGGGVLGSRRDAARVAG